MYYPKYEYWHYKKETVLERRFMTFTIIDNIVLLDKDRHESRKTTKHKWRVDHQWSRLSHHIGTMKRMPITRYAINLALDYFRMKIEYKEELG